MARTDHLIDDATLSVQELARIYRDLPEGRRWAFACSLCDACFEALFAYLSNSAGQPAPGHTPIQEARPARGPAAAGRSTDGATGGASNDNASAAAGAGMGD